MKNKAVLIIGFVLVAGLVAWYFITRKKVSAQELDMRRRAFMEDQPTSYMDERGNVAVEPNRARGEVAGYLAEKTPEGKTIIPISGVTPAGGTAKDWLRANIGYSYEAMQVISEKEAKLLRMFIEEYSRKGRKVPAGSKAAKQWAAINKKLGI